MFGIDATPSGQAAHQRLPSAPTVGAHATSVITASSRATARVVITNRRRSARRAVPFDSCWSRPCCRSSSPMTASARSAPLSPTPTAGRWNRRVDGVRRLLTFRSDGTLETRNRGGFPREIFCERRGSWHQRAGYSTRRSNGDRGAKQLYDQRRVRAAYG